MADKLMRAQVRIPRVSGAPADDITNTWYFDGDDGHVDADYHDGVMTLLTNFYNSIDGLILSSMLTTTAVVNIYDMRDPEPRIPEATDTIALTLNTDVNLPAEVAICLSFRATPASGVNPARRRGRVYLGPITYAALQQMDTDVEVASSVRTSLATAAAAMAGGAPLPTIGSVRWAIYSPTTDLTSTIDDAFNDVASGWIDSALDTQRRRGQKARGRTNW